MADLLSDKDRAIIPTTVPAGAALARDITAGGPLAHWGASNALVWLIDSSGRYVVVDAETTASIASMSEPQRISDIGQRFAVQTVLTTYSFGGPRLTSESGPWIAALERELEQFANLGAGWDSYNAPAVQPAEIGAARQLLRSLAAENILRPAITVTARGHVQFEWHTHQKDIEIELLGPEQYSILYEEPTGGSWEGTVSGVGALRMIFDQLRAR
jgi:hypothetical protein